MKKPEWKIILASLAYTYLYFETSPGINFLLFTLILIGLLLINKPSLVKKWKWLTAASGALLSSVFIYYYGTSLPFIANILSTLMLVGFSYEGSSSLLMSIFQSVYSIVSTIPKAIYSSIKSKKSVESNEEIKGIGLIKKFLLLIFPFILLLLFFSLYQSSNPVFKKFTEEINLDWLDFDLIRFFLIGSLLMYSAFIPSVLNYLMNKSKEAKEDLNSSVDSIHQNSIFSKFIKIESEKFIGLTILGVLNALILLLNVLDISSLWFNNIPEGMVFSESLRSGTFSLILSIILATLVILFFFRGFFNFSKEGKWMKILGYVWIVQNIVMVVSAIYRNNLYINSYGITHKRLGVYFYLLLAVIGLVVTFIKVLKKKNIWFLIRKNAWIFYLVLIVSSFINWDMYITNTNLKIANEQNIIELDKTYLNRLSHVNIGIMAKQEAEKPVENNFYHSEKHDELENKINNLLYYEQNGKWQSQCISKNKNLDQLKALNEEGKIKSIWLDKYRSDNIPEYKTIDNLSALGLWNSNKELDFSSINFYKNIQYLNIKNSIIYDLDSLKHNKKITHLNISVNTVYSYKNLDQLESLSHLNISNNKNHKRLLSKEFPSLKKLQYLNISNIKMDNFDFLKRQENLKELVYQNPNRINRLPEINSLEKIVLDNNGNINLNNFTDVLYSKNLKHISLNNTMLKNILPFDSELMSKTTLKTINLNNNQLVSILPLEKHTSLESLYLNNNQINSISGLKNLHKLKTLQINGNQKIEDLEVISDKTSLQNLSLNNLALYVFPDLQNLRNLRNLSLSQNSIVSIDSIKFNSQIEVLNISNNNIENINVLKECKNLKKLYLGYNRIIDYSVLFEMENLEYLSLGDVKLSLVEQLKVAYPKLVIDYYSNSLNHSISYNNNKRNFYSESF